VIGVPGDRVAVRDGRVFVNGIELDEPYVARGQSACFTRWCDVTLAPGQFYVMGDNRANSSDSRAWGPVTQGNIVGRAWLLYYPLSEFGLAP
jgi:signal peptidase I